MPDELFQESYKFTFTSEQIKKILFQVLLSNNKLVPIDVLRRESTWNEYDSPVCVSAVNVDENDNEIFDIEVTWTENDISDFKKAQQEQKAEEPWNSNVTVVGCGKKCPVKG